jgi:aminopeptidase N
MDDRTLKTSVLALFSFVALSACGDDSSANGGSAQGGAGGTAGSGNGGEPGIGGAGPMAAEITRYDVDIDLTSDLATLALRLDVTAAGSCFSVPSERPALAVRFDDAPALSFTVDENLLTACSASELAVGEHTLAVDVQLAEKTYHGLDIGYSTTPDLSGSDFTYLLSWVGGCDHFGPCDDDPARLVSFGFNVTHPEGTVVLCPGALTSGPTETRCALDSTLAPTYSAFSVAADAAWVASPLLSVPSAEITLYEVPEELCVRRDPVPARRWPELAACCRGQVDRRHRSDRPRRPRRVATCLPLAGYGGDPLRLNRRLRWYSRGLFARSHRCVSILVLEVL